MNEPPRWNAEQLALDMAKSAEVFRKERIEEPVEKRARPFTLQDIGGLDLAPGCVRADKGIARIPAEESVLLVVPPHKVQAIVL